MGLRIACNLFGGAGGDDFAALVAAFGSQIDQPVRGFNHIEIVFDDQERCAGFEKFAESGEKFGDVVEVQAGGGLVENVEDALIFCASKVRGELQALGFAAGKRRGGLAEAQIAQADFVQHAELGNDLGMSTKKASASRTVMPERREHSFRDSALRGRCF